MIASTSVMYSLLLSVLVAYLLGSVPVAALVSRRRRVDIFFVGTRLAGAANVFRSVGPFYGIVVFLGDVAKGVLAIMVAYRLGVEGELILLVALATLIGHWRSVFTRFRGGDGLSTLGGITLAILPLYGVPALLMGGGVGGVARGPGHHPTLWGGTAGYGLLLLGTPFSPEHTAMVLGLVVLASMVLLRAVRGHRARRAASPE